jgi:hypothetical protein
MTLEPTLVEINDMYDLLLERLNFMTKLYIEHANDLVNRQLVINNRREKFNLKISQEITNEYEFINDQDLALNQILNTNFI